jgi:hypothetical protein
MVLIKTEIIHLLKFCLKHNGMSHQHQLNIVTCHVIKFFLKKLKITLILLKIKFHLK